MQRDEIIQVLNEWNFWNRELKPTYKRESYEKQIKSLSKAGEILFIKGVRRSGKSTLLLNQIKYLLESGVPKEEILFVNLEDPRFASNLSLQLLEDIKQAYLYYISPKNKPYIFLDEVQNIENFEKWLLKEYELQTSYLFATGSNSKLLSKEIGSALSGRYLDILVYPLSFKEFLLFKGVNITNHFELITNNAMIEKLFAEYIEFGGFPKVVLSDDTQLKRQELKNYFDSILLRDIVARYNLDNFRVLERLAIYLLSSFSNNISINKIKNHLKISYDMANRYFEYLQNSFIVDTITQFDWSYKKQLSSTKKTYSIDTGLIQRVSFLVGKKQGDFLENIVFLELKRRYEQIYYYKTKQDYEVDFLVQQQNRITTLIQVSWTINDDKTFKRELRGLIKACNELQIQNININLIVLTMDKTRQLNLDDKQINIKNVIEWLIFD